VAIKLAPSTTSARPQTWPLAGAVAGAMCISASAVLFTLADVQPVTAAFYRCVLPLPALAVLAVAEHRRDGRRRLASRACSALAGFFLALNLVFWIHAIADVGAGAATVLGNLQVIFVGPLAWAVFRERLDRRLLATVPVVLVGVVLVSGMLGHDGTGLHPVAGVLFGLATSVTYACFLLILRRAAGHTPYVASQLFDATAGAAAGALLLGASSGGMQLAISLRSLMWLLVLTLTSGIVGWLLITASLPHMSSTAAAVVLLLEPAGALVLAGVTLGQRPSLLQLTGAALICAGVLIVARGEARTAPRGSSPRRPGPSTPASRAN